MIRVYSCVFAATVLLLISVGCGSAPVPPPDQDATLPSWYARTVDQLTELNRRAEHAFETGKSDDAAAIIKEAQSLAARVLSVRRPTLEGAEAAADLDDLYGRMLLANRHYADAQLFFQKNRSRWKNWRPQTSDTERRLKLAESAIQECEKHLAD
jgi:hypothetical protein